MALTTKLLDLLVLCLNISFVVLIQQCFMKTDAQEVLITLQKPRLIKCKIDKIYQIGDSLSDTGNCIRENFCRAHSDCKRLPYGMNYFQHKSTGRCSDGMLMIDFIALESGLPLLNPYKLQNGNFRHGVNFAVAGATALPTEILTGKNIVNSFTNGSLSMQLDLMSSHLATTCSTDCPQYLKKSLFLVGEIGGNDFNYGLSQSKSMKELRSMVPDIVRAIIDGVMRAISFGAIRIIVPGNFPIGCHPIMLAQFMTDNSTAYDEYQCLKKLNNLAIFYNEHLQQAIEELKNEYSNIALIYGDYYNAYLWLLQNAASLGFDKNSLQKACCGLPNYNLEKSVRCGAPGAQVCADPSAYISWDGMHMTQEAYKWMARWLIDDMLPELRCQV